MPNSRSGKEACRQEGKRRRAALLSEERKAAEKQIRERLRRTSAYQAAEEILIYASYLDEVSTWELMEQAFSDQKKVFCPRTVITLEGEKRLDFYEIQAVSDLIPGFRGIMEPGTKGKIWAVGTTEQTVGAAGMQAGRTLIILPGCAFDREGRRLGYGGGFYDRFLEKNIEPVKIGLCFSCQLLEELPEEKTDIRPDFLITEKEIIDCRKTAYAMFS